MRRQDKRLWLVLRGGTDAAAAGDLGRIFKELSGASGCIQVLHATLDFH
jgi:hypothetical protein